MTVAWGRKLSAYRVHFREALKAYRITHHIILVHDLILIFLELVLAAIAGPTRRPSDDFIRCDRGRLSCQLCIPSSQEPPS